MKGFHINIEQETLTNTNFRKVLYTAKRSQLVLMSLLPREEVGLETHPDNDQFFRFEKGYGKSVVDENEYVVGPGSVIVIPAGAKHNIINLSKDEDLKMYTLYAPPHHKDGLVNATKADALASDKDFDGVTTEPVP